MYKRQVIYLKKWNVSNSSSFSVKSLSSAVVQHLEFSSRILKYLSEKSWITCSVKSDPGMDGSFLLSEIVMEMELHITVHKINNLYLYFRSHIWKIEIMILKDNRIDIKYLDELEMQEFWLLSVRFEPVTYLEDVWCKTVHLVCRRSLVQTPHWKVHKFLRFEFV